MKKILTLSLICVLALPFVACTNMSKTEQGAVSGAAGGALVGATIGAIVDGRSGAAAGGVGGAMVGNNQEQNAR